MHFTSYKGIILLLFCLMFLASTCEETTLSGPLPEDLTKERRERLGDLLHQVIVQSPKEYPILNRVSKRDSVIQTYLQTLYDQATQRIRLDRTTAITSRWNQERLWQVTVLADNNRYAFTIPGGYFYISTGFLEGIKRGYEIYYIMAFEAANVGDGFLIDNLSNEYDIATLLDIIEDPDSFSPLMLEEIVAYLKKESTYESSIVQEIDKVTAEIICETSIFDRFGIIPILEELHFREQWRDTRPSYANRLEYIHSLKVDDCGNIKSTGAYQKMVLDNL